MPEEFWSHLWAGLVGTIVFGLAGIFLLTLGAKVFDWITPKLDVQHELAEKGNVAVAIVCAAIVLGICHIVAVAIK